MTPQLFMLAQYIELYLHKARSEDAGSYDYFHGQISVHITDDGYEYSDDFDETETRYPLTTVSQLRQLISNQ